MTRAAQAALAAWLFMALPAQSQIADPEKAEIATDRESASGTTVPKGSLQLENGIGWEKQYRNWTMDGFQSSARFGVGNRTEVQVGVPDYSIGLGAHQPASGFGDVTLGVKQQLFPTDATFQMGINPTITFPSGSAARSDHSYTPGLVVPLSIEPDDVWSFALVLAGSAPKEYGRRTFLGGAEAYAGRRFGTRFDPYVAYAGEYPRAGAAAHSVNFGAAYLITKRQQIDLYVGRGLSHAAPGVSAGVGYSIRLDGLFAR